MILTGHEIRRQVELGSIQITPFNHKFLNPNSYDFTLGDSLIVYRKRLLDTKSNNPIKRIYIGDSGIKLSPDRLYLAHTVEHFATNDYVPMLFAKSSVARLGLFIHATANLIDIGHRGQWTLQLHAVQPIRIYAGMRIGQATFWKPKGKIELYRGKYQDSKGPLPSKLEKVD